MESEFDVKINTSVLYDYMLHHTYMSFSGMFGNVVGALLIILACAYGGNWYLLIAGAIILLYTPCSLYLRAKKQALSNPAFKNPLHYKMDENGVTVSQGEYQEFTEWNAVQKATSTNRSIFLYTSKVNAWIFPKRDLGEKKEEVIEMISIHVAPDKIKIKQ